MVTHRTAQHSAQVRNVPAISEAAESSTTGQGCLDSPITQEPWPYQYRYIMPSILVPPPIALQQSADVSVASATSTSQVQSQPSSMSCQEVPQVPLHGQPTVEYYRSDLFPPSSETADTSEERPAEVALSSIPKRGAGSEVSPTLPKLQSMLIVR